MHVFRLGSKSVNYANKIIMQESKTPENSFIVSHQLVKNISLSNLSDADTIQSNDDVDDVMRLRKFSSDRMPLYGDQLNYSYEHLEQSRKPSTDFRFGIAVFQIESPDLFDSLCHISLIIQRLAFFRCGEISSGYSSPASPQYFQLPSRAQAYIEVIHGEIRFPKGFV